LNVIDSNQAPVHPASTHFKLPARRAIFWAFLACLLLVGLVAGRQFLTGRQAGEAIIPDNLLAQAIPITADHTSRDKQISLPGGSADGQPQADLPVSYRDYGRIDKSVPIRSSFLLWNRGDAPLRIQKAYTTCACTIAQISSADIPPGMASQISIQFDPGVHNVAGMTVRRGLILETNDPAVPGMEIWIQVSVNP
jgi:hypothetical protein